MMKRIQLFILIFLNFSFADAAFEDIPVSGRSTSLASTLVALQANPESIFINPAGLSHVITPSFQFGSGYLYNMKELPFYTFSTAIPTSKGMIGLGIQYFGSKLYQEWRIHKGWCQTIEERLHAGLSFCTQGLQIQNYGNTITWQINAGLIYDIQPNFHWGFSISNLTRNRIGKAREMLPQTMHMGLAYSPYQKLTLLMELGKDVRFPVEWKGAVEYEMMKGFFLRWGHVQRPAMMTMGFGFEWKRMHMDYGYQWHPVLGPTHMMSVSLD